MSIIQQALKKAQGDFSEETTSRVKEPVIAAKPAKEEAVFEGAASLDKKTFLTGSKTHIPHSMKKLASMRMPALIGILVMLLLIYGLRLSSQYSWPQANRIERFSPGPVSAVAAKSSGVFTPPKIDPPSFITPRNALFALNGIMYVENKPQAIINGYVLEEGDKINGATVLLIDKDFVLLDVNEANVRLELNK